MIQLRWVVPSKTTTETPRLQWREKSHSGFGMGRWGPWYTVPKVIDDSAFARKQEEER